MVFGNLLPFPALVVCKEDKTALVKAFQQHHAGSGQTFRGNRCKCHRRRLLDFRQNRLVHPDSELLDRVRQDMLNIELALEVFVPYPGKVVVLHEAKVGEKVGS